MTHYGALDGLLDQDERDALALVRDRFGLDPARTYQFWERFTARMLDGEVTPAGCPWDVEAQGIRVEVKFSQEFVVRFTHGARRVFRWVDLRRKAADAVLMYGIDGRDHVFLWAAPPSTLGRSVTLTSPRDRVGPDRSPLRRWPIDQVAPAVARCAQAS